MKRFVAMAACLALTGCAAGMSSLAPQEQRALDTRIVRAGYDQTFSATMTVMEDKGYIVSTADKGSGLLNTEYKPYDGPNSGLAKALIGDIRAKANATLRKIGPDSTRVHLSIILENQGSRGNWERLDLSASKTKAGLDNWFAAIDSLARGK